MSRQLIDRNPDLRRLKEEGYDVEVLPGFVLVKRVPYVTASKEIKLGAAENVDDLAAFKVFREDGFFYPSENGYSIQVTIASRRIN